MSNSHSRNNKRIAKNTLILYARMLFLMVISLYTSRVILQTLGVEDFGTYNVVGGFVALFAVLSQSLSSAASRFLTFEMGRGYEEKLEKVFSTILIIHILLAAVIAILAEAFGIWFVNHKMVVDQSRLEAANWVFQFSVLTFCVNLVTVPHNAAIIAHERMNAFAYIGIFDGIGKLLICYLLLVSPIDRLLFYGLLMFLIQLVSRGMYYIYCKKHFSECHLRLIYDKQLLKEISGFAGWNMIGSSSAILRNQGGNILINLFYGPVVNAARSIANQVLHAVNGFVENFFTALKPQITKSYASGDRNYMMSLIFQGCRLSYYMLLALSLPILMNTNYLLHLWLKNVPDSSNIFVQLTLVFTMIESISTPLITAQQATGKVRNYQLVVGGIQLLNLPISYIFLKLGGVPETILYVAIFLSVCCLGARLYMLRTNISLDVWSFIKKVILNIFNVSCVALVIPLTLRQVLDNSFLTLIVITIACLVCSILSILYVGCSNDERKFVYAKTSQLRNKILKKNR